MSERNLIISQIKALTIFNANDTTMTVDECAEFLGVHPNTVKNRIQKETIIATFQDSKYHIPKLQFLEQLVDKFLEDQDEVAEMSKEDEFDMNMKKWFRDYVFKKDEAI